jgi:hypothetical protein
VQIDDVPDNEPIMPGSRLQADRVFERQNAHARARSQLDRDAARPKRLLEQIYFQLIIGVREPQHQARISAGGLDHSRPVADGRKRPSHVLSDIWQGFMVRRGEIQILRWAVHDLMSTECVPSR